MTKLLVSVRGYKEAVEAANGGAHILDAEYPGSALGTVYPLNIAAIRSKLDKSGFSRRPVSTNIGEEQTVRSTACQAALGVATAGATFVKCGLAKFDLQEARYLGISIVRTVKRWYPRTRVIPSVFVDPDLSKYFDPFEDGLALVKDINADGMLIDTFHKKRGKGLLDFTTATEIRRWTKRLHLLGKQAWVAGSVSKEQLALLSQCNVDVICVRGAACEQFSKQGRMGVITSRKVSELVASLRE
ncbi:hypothetical protein KKH27_01220 [bacterium]|nr:hypothetical protein [bacterium]